MDYTKEAIIGTTKLVSIRLFVEGDVTDHSQIIDFDKLEIGSLSIDKDGREYWCDTHVIGASYDKRNNETQVTLELFDNPEDCPESKQDLTEEDLFSAPEFYLWWECMEEPMEITMLAEKGIDSSSTSRTIHTIKLN
jgi:hypothetical protein